MSAGRGARWALAGAAFVMTLGLAEVGLRVLGLPRPLAPPTFVGAGNDDLGLVADPDCFWLLAPTNPAYDVDATGMRGYVPPATPADEDTYRIVCVGDSCTFGIGVKLEQSYGVQLERLVQERLRRGRCEVVLCATPAFSSYQSRVLFEREGLPRRPDLTVVYLGAWNDYQEPFTLDSGAARTDRQIGVLTDPDRARGVSRILDLVTGAAAAPDGPAPTARVPVADYESNLRTVLEAARACGSEVLLVVPPLRADAEAEYPQALEYRAAARRLARELACESVDGPALFAAMLESAGDSWRADYAAPASPLFRDGAHPAPFGHRILAWHLAEKILAPASLSEKLRRLTGAAPHPQAPAPFEGRVTPATLAAVSADQTLRITGELPSDVRRVWIGELWGRQLRRIADDALECELPSSAAPALRRIRLDTGSGIVDTGLDLEVRGPALTVVDAHWNGAGDLEVRCQLHAATLPARGAGLYVALRAGQARSTLFGEFELEHADPLSGLGLPLSDASQRAPDWRTARDPAAGSVPAFPAKFPPLAANGGTDATGTWTTTITVPSDAARPGVAVQGIVFSTFVIGDDAETARLAKLRGHVGALSLAVDVPLPPR